MPQESPSQNNDSEKHDEAIRAAMQVRLNTILFKDREKRTDIDDDDDTKDVEKE